MDTRPIGIFDSGLGGLTAVRVLAQAAPWESFVYLGDTGNAPYGDRSVEDIRALSRRNARYLRSHDVKAILVACNTSTTNALPWLEADNADIPVVGALSPSVAAAVEASKTGRIGVLATAATVNSGGYQTAITARLPSAQVTAVGCPKLVPLIESGHTDPGDPAMEAAVEEYTAPLRQAGVDTVILGCTHYPLARDAIAQIMGPDTALIDAGAASVGALLEALATRDALGDMTAKAGSRKFYCSAGKDLFTTLGSAFLGWSMEGLTEEIQY